MTAGVLSFVACAKDGSFKPLPDGNDAIRATFERIEAAGGDVVKVASLSQIVVELDRRQKERIDTIQVIGHGTPGMLSLAYTWDKEYDAVVNGKKQHYVLDSNPYAHGILANSLAPFMTRNRIPRVILVGCKVGSNDKTPYIARGSSLIFDLHKMWGCFVLGAVDLLGPDDFVNGRFVGRVQGFAPSGKQGSARWRKVNDEYRPADRPKPVPGASPGRIRNVKLVDVPAMGLLNQAHSLVGEGVTATEKSLEEFSQKVTMKHPLAMAELTLTASVDDEEAELEVLANASLLRVTRAGTISYYRRPGGQGDTKPDRGARERLRRAVFGDPLEPA